MADVTVVTGSPDVTVHISIEYHGTQMFKFGTMYSTIPVTEEAVRRLLEQTCDDLVTEQQKYHRHWEREVPGEKDD